jgi:poly(ADP-ribose) glycohydrolase ARH3
VGDALGMPFEGAPPHTIPEKLDMLEARLGRGTYTDDTQMAIALAESLLERDGIDADHLGKAFLEAFDPSRGYGSGTTTVLAMVRSGVAPTDAAVRAFGGQGSMGNGACMRIAPLAVRFASQPERLLEEAEASARVTHAHLFAVDAARVQAAAIAAALRDEDPLFHAYAAASSAELRHRLDGVAALLLGEGTTVATRGDVRRPAKDPPEPREVARTLGNSTVAHESVPTALYAATAHDAFEEAVTFAIRCGGDTDTIGAMAGAIAGARDGTAGIPGRWVEALEEGEKGRSHVERLADRLAE